MKVLQLMAGASQGGAERFFERLTLGLQEAGVDQHAAIRTNTRRTALLRQGGVPVTQCRFGGPLDIMTAIKLRSLVTRLEPNIALAWMNRAAAATPRGRHITIGRLGGYYNLKYYNNCHHLIGNTPDLRDHIVRNGWPADRAWYIPNFAEEAEAAPQPRAALNTPDAAPLLLCLGRLHQNKGFDVAIGALAQVPDAYLWIAGAGPEDATLKSLAQRTGVGDRVRFLGWRDDPEALLAAADVFLCSSRHEPLGNMVLEAWLHGVPVVACDSQGPGFLVDHGETGLLSPINDPVGLAASIQTVIDNPDLADRLAQAGAAEYRNKYSKAHVVDAYQTLFQTVLARKA
ncbi:MAG: glycosyltransferase [Alphaproteobacteria bacterium]|nr:glycosyltransferase [Alphaproteobacteria bacterium]